jgi:hypothetical protein
MMMVGQSDEEVKVLLWGGGGGRGGGLHARLEYILHAVHLSNSRDD